MEVLDHLERGETQVDPVEERHEVADHQERHDAQGHLPHRPCFHCVVAGSFEDGIGSGLTFLSRLLTMHFN